MWLKHKNLLKLGKVLRYFCLILFVMILSFKSFAYVGWYKEGDKMTYVTSGGYKIANAWRESDGMKFFLDENGYVIYNKVFDHNGKFYYVGPNGARITNQFVNVTSDMIIGDSIAPGCFYFTEDGSAFVKNGNNFIKTIDNRKYAFDDTGHVYVDCWISKEGDYVEPTDALLDGYYLAKENGILYQNEWYDFTMDSASDADMGESTIIAKDYYDLDGLWMYFDSKCTKITANGNISKKITLNGKNYSFDEHGILVLGFEKNKTDIDTHQASNPTLLDRIRVYDESSGEILKNRWLYDVTPYAFSEDDYDDGKEYWYYIDGDGSIVKNKIKNIAGGKYSFDGLGRLRKGFVLIDGISFYGAEYKAEDLSRDDFIYSVAEGGRLYGSDLLDLHYFDEAESENEGRMVTGDINIELSDGTYDFNFRGNGVAFGNKNELKFYKSSYYRNGIKFIPWEDTRYGIVKVADDEYRVIDKNGKLVTGRKKVIKDDYENFIVVLNDRLAAYIKEPARRVKLRWKTFGDVTGYYYYDMDYAKKRYAGLAVASGTTCPTAAQINDIPKDLRVNFR